MNKEDRFETFYRNNYARLYSVAQQILGDEEAARDLVSDAFELAWKRFDDGREDTLGAYLNMYIRSRSIDQLRHRDVHATYVDFVQNITEEADSQDDVLQRESKIREVHRILGLLSERTRKIFVECYVNNKHYAEVAEQMGISQVAVKKAVMNALSKFRSEMPQNDK